MKKYIACATVSALFLSITYADTLRVTANPGPRGMACMITDSLNSRAILFGGADRFLSWGQYFNDVWSLDFSSETWKCFNVSGARPSPRVCAAVAYDCAGNRMLLFGGWMDAGYNDMWTFDLTMGAETWTQLTPSGTPPSPRQTAGIIDPVANRMIIFGGKGTMVSNDTWSLDLNTLIWSALVPSGALPSPRYGHTAVYDPFDHRMLIFGGTALDEPMMNDVWALDLTEGNETWHQLYPSGGPPGRRARHFCVFDKARDEMVIGFGYDFSGYHLYYNDLWALSLGTMSWQQLPFSGVSIEGRREACAAYGVDGYQIFIFGGNLSDGFSHYYFGDTYVLTRDTLAILEDKRNRVVVSPYIRITPNPFSLPCNINVFLPSSGEANLKVLDVTGRVINTLLLNARNSGNYIIEWDGTDSNGTHVPAGTYFFKMDIDGKSVVEKAVVVK